MYSENYSRQTALAGAERARAPETTDHELAALGRSEEVMVRATVAERVETPLTVLLKLAEDDATSVRAGLARNEREDLPLEVREGLAKDKAPEVQLALVRNPAAPNSVIVTLSHSRQRDIANVARKRLSEQGAKAAILGRVGIATS